MPIAAYLGGPAPTRRDAFVAAAPPGWQVVIPDPRASDAELIEQIQDADFLVCAPDGRPNRRFPDGIVKVVRLKLIQTLGQGTDYLPVRLAMERGIPVANAGGVNAVAVAEHTILLILAVLRRLLPSVEAMRQGKFRTNSDLIDAQYFHLLCDKTLGIVGFGHIGQRVAKLARGFDASVIFVKEKGPPGSIVTRLPARRVTLEDLLVSADIITLHVPLKENTTRLIGWPQLTMMKPSAILVNTSRGGVVDEAALIRALREKKICGAGLDVFEQHPPAMDNPLLRMDNVVATPHIGGRAAEIQTRQIKSIWANLVRVWEGHDPNDIVAYF